MPEPLFRMLPVETILPDEYQPRRSRNESDIEKLAESISQLGIIQPLTVRYCGKGEYRIIAGERRYRAGLKAGVRALPCIILDVTEENAAIITVTENLQRRALNCFEEAQGISAIMKGLDLTEEEVAAKIGMNKATVVNKLRLLQIPNDVREYLINNRIGEREARSIIDLPQKQAMEAAIKIVQYKMNSPKNEELNSDKSESKKPRKKKMKGFCSDSRLYINSLNQTLGLMRASGVAGESKREELDDKIIYTFVIRKTV